MSTILLLTANDKNQYLDNLTREVNDIQTLLYATERKNFDIQLIPETTTQRIIDALNAPNREIEILHYAGHADGSILRLTDTDASAEAFAQKLRGYPSLKLVFLNGCASKGQVVFFHDAQIPFVIATARPIEDNKASWVATQFYNYLALGRTLKGAFEEVVNDANLQNKQIDFVNTRGIGIISDVKENVFEWGLYVREGSETADYSLPFAQNAPTQTLELNHTIFLNDLIFALETVKNPAFKNIQKLAVSLRNGVVSNGKKLSELLKVLPFTLGKRIQQIAAEPDEKTLDYYRELLYDYVFLFETLLHHTASILVAEIWNNKKAALQIKPDDFQTMLSFWQKDRLNESPEAYKQQIVQLYAWLDAAHIKNDFLDSSKTDVLNYLNSEQFANAAAYFYQQKCLFSQRIRFNQNELVKNCFASQTHLTKAFSALRHIATFTMASVRGINVVNLRYLDCDYGHTISKLVVSDAEPSPVSSTKMLENKSILCYISDESDLDDIVNISDTFNLFPFIIDRNVFAEKQNSEVDLYLFIGYFPDPNGIKQYHFASVSDPSKIWQFDESQNNVSLLHIGEPADLTHQANHLMANAGEFKMYLTEFKNTFLNT